MSEQEFDDFYTAFYTRVVAAVFARTGDRDAAEECTQEAFARAWQHRRKLGPHPEAWVHLTAKRLAISRWRRMVKGRRDPDRALQNHTSMPELSESHVALITALQTLPAAQRDALVLHHIVDLPVDAVARELDAPTGTIKARLSRGRAALAAILGDDVPGDAQGGVSHA